MHELHFSVLAVLAEMLRQSSDPLRIGTGTGSGIDQDNDSFQLVLL